jgi:DNA polymerase I-like protein with 3'-5' exonuclease and polymerase domains
MIALDTETTGLDLRHGAKPFFVTICRDDGTQTYYEWRVDPLTRDPVIPPEDKEAIQDLLESVRESDEQLVLQNPKFDCAALASIGITNFPWSNVWDTLLASHLLASNLRHDLTSLAMQYLGIDILPLEKRLHNACAEARRKVQQAKLKKKRGSDYGKLADWRIADEGMSDIPSASGECWKYDMWLPRALAREQGLPRDHYWWNALADYSNADSSVTLLLMQTMRKEIQRRGLWEIYLQRLKLPAIAYNMEARGVTASKANLDTITTRYVEDSARLGRVCVSIAASLGYNLQLPRGASPNDSLRTFMLDVLKVPPIRGKKSKTAAPTLDKDAMAHYLATLPPKSKALTFVQSLLSKRARDTSLAYMAAYKRFWLPWGVPKYEPPECEVCGHVCVAEICNSCGAIQKRAGWYVLHPSLNPTGTNTLRWSSSNPNEQNISKKKSECQWCEGKGTNSSGEPCTRCGGSGIELYSIRMCFGPAPGREWWSCDGKNLELRIPAYEAGEEDMLALFERPDDSPYYGSNHLLNFHTVYPDLWDAAVREVGEDRAGPYCKKKYDSTWYQWCKNGGFAVQYGAIEKPGGLGTADRSFHKAGAHALQKYGYVETIPDTSVDPKHGYPLMCTRTEWGKILPTVPLNYRVQGTACWWMMMAMIRCQEQLDKWNRVDSCFGTSNGGYHITMQVHDELVFDFPRRGDPVADAALEKSGKLPLMRTQSSSNLWRIRLLQKLMEKGGEGIGVPTPVSCEYHVANWAKGVTL